MRKILMTLVALALMTGPALANRNYITWDSTQQVGANTPPISDYINDYVLVANTAATVTWPSGANYANISCSTTSSPIYSSLNSGITVPGASVTNGTGAAVNSAQRKRGTETAFYIISAGTPTCSVEFWWGPQ